MSWSKFQTHNTQRHGLHLLLLWDRGCNLAEVMLETNSCRFYQVNKFPVRKRKKIPKAVLMLVNRLDVIQQTFCLHTMVIDRWYHNAGNRLWKVPNSRSQFLYAFHPQGWLQDADMLGSSSLSGQIGILCGGEGQEVFQESRLHLLCFPSMGYFLIRAPVLLLSVCSTGGLLHCCRLFFFSHKRHTTKTNSGICRAVIHPLSPAWIFDTVSAVYNCFWSNRLEISPADQQCQQLERKKKKEKNLPLGPRIQEPLEILIRVLVCRGVTSVAHAATPMLPLISVLCRASSCLCTELMNSAVVWQRMKVPPICFQRKPSDRCCSYAQCEHFSGTLTWYSCRGLILGWNVTVGRLGKKKKFFFNYLSNSKTKCVFTFILFFLKKASFSVPLTNGFS